MFRRPSPSAARLWIAPLVVAVCTAATSFAAEPLPARIDKLVAAKYSGPVAPPADDAEFMRRAYLDFAGRIPTVAEARAFLADGAKDKRAKLIDRLFASDDFPRRMTAAFNAMLMERRGENEEWTKFLQASFEQNKPWDVLVREMIDPRDDDPAVRGGAYFAVNRLSKVGQQDTDYPGLTRDVGRLFLGMDLQCAQCHNHLFIDDYKQIDFQGLYTVFLNTSIRNGVTFPALDENVMVKKIEFMSVFDKEQLAVGPRVPGMREISIPSFPKGEEYAIVPDKKNKITGVPKFSPLEALARDVTAPDNRSFRENIANRLWWLAMGQGIVDPLDQFHSGNPPTHPELLTLLADEMLARKFDMRSFLRELALSEAYARGGAWTPTDKPRPAAGTYATAVAKPLSAEQMLQAYTTATGPHDAKLVNEDLRQRFVKAFANPPKEPEIEFAPSVKAALFLSNDNVVLGLLKPADGNLVDRLTKLDNADKIAEELYLAVLTRLPNDDERAEVKTYLTKYAADKPKLLGHLAWALVSSTEFCLNH